ncbi:MAG: hypothetical protein M9940_01370, partial [Bacteroidetes bacterium]|nr:hypothetical protein [Bacteroidota bacterium]
SFSRHQENDISLQFRWLRKQILLCQLLLKIFPTLSNCNPAVPQYCGTAGLFTSTRACFLLGVLMSNCEAVKRWQFCLFSGFQQFLFPLPSTRKVHKRFGLLDFHCRKYAP